MATRDVDTTAPSRRRAFISYSGVEPIGRFARAVTEAGFEPFTSYDLPAAMPHAQALLHELREASVAIFVINDRRQALNSSVELGIALAVDLPIVILAGPEAELPEIAGRLPVLRVDVDDPDGLHRVLAAVSDVASTVTLDPPSAARPLRQHARRLLDGWYKERRELERPARPSGERSEELAEWIVADAFRSAGIKALREPGGGKAGTDFVVWDREVEPFVGGPLLVEVVSGAWSPRRLDLKVRQLTEYLGQLPSSMWALVVIAGRVEEALTLEPEHAPILLISLEDLLERLQTESFADIVRMLRNERVHR